MERRVLLDKTSSAAYWHAAVGGRLRTTNSMTRINKVR
jgi:hypothetical protein